MQWWLSSKHWSRAKHCHRTWGLITLPKSPRFSSPRKDQSVSRASLGLPSIQRSSRSTIWQMIARRAPRMVANTVGRNSEHRRRGWAEGRRKWRQASTSKSGITVTRECPISPRPSCGRLSSPRRKPILTRYWHRNRRQAAKPSSIETTTRLSRRKS